MSRVSHGAAALSAGLASSGDLLFIPPPKENYTHFLLLLGSNGLLPEFPPPAAAGRWSSPGDKRAGTRQGRLPHPATVTSLHSSRSPREQEETQGWETRPDLPCP